MSPEEGVVSGPPKNENLGKLYPSLGISQNLLMGLGVSDFASVGHTIFFSVKSLKFSVSVSDFKTPVSASRIYHSPPLEDAISFFTMFNLYLSQISILKAVLLSHPRKHRMTNSF